MKKPRIPTNLIANNVQSSIGGMTRANCREQKPTETNATKALEPHLEARAAELFESGSASTIATARLIAEFGVDHE